MMPERLPPARRSSTATDSAASTATSRPERAIERLDDRLRSMAVDLGVQMQVSPLLYLTGAGVVAALFGVRLAGWPAAVVGVTGVAISPVLVRPLAERRRRAMQAVELADRCSSMARSVRSGVTLQQVFVELTDDRGAHDDLRRIGAQVARGRPLSDALAEVAGTASCATVVLVTTALSLGEERGGDVADCLEAAAQVIRRERVVEAKRRVAVAQSRLSAHVLAALPIVFAVFVSTLRDGPAFTGAVGAVSLAAGVGLDVGGLYWMHRLIGRLQ